MPDKERPSLNDFVPNSLWVYVSNFPSQPRGIVRVTRTSHVLGGINITAYELEDDYKDPKNFGSLWRIHIELPPEGNLYAMADPEIHGAESSVDVIADMDKYLVEWPTSCRLVTLSREQQVEILNIQTQIRSRHRLER